MVAAAFDCTDNVNGKTYLDSDPSVECNLDHELYYNLYKKSSAGLAGWIVAVALFSSQFLRSSGQNRMSYLVGNYETHWYW